MFFDEREGSIIGSHNILILGRFGYHTLSFRADTRIDDRNKGCPLRPVIYCLKETVTPFKDIVGGNIMS